MKEIAGRYAPTVERTYAGWHQACVESGDVCLQRCGDCGAYQHPPRELCPRCGSATLGYEPIEGVGTCYSYTVTHSSRDAAWSAQTPFATVVVGLPQGVRCIAAWGAGDGQVPVMGECVELTVEVIDGRFAFLWGVPCKK